MKYHNLLGINRFVRGCDSGETVRLFPKREPDKKPEKRNSPALSDAQERLLSSTLKEEENFAYSQELSHLLFNIEKTRVLPGINPELIGQRQIELVAPKETSEPSASGSSQVTYVRWRVVYAQTSLSVRASSGLIEIFLLPAQKNPAPVLAFEENNNRLLKRIHLRGVEPEPKWYCLNELMTPEAMERLLNGCTRKLIAAASGWEQAEHLQVGRSASASGERPGSRSPDYIKFGDVGASGENRSSGATEERSENLIFAEMSEKEALMGSIARDIHDNVIADLLMLRRYVTGRNVSPEETVEIVDEIVAKLREICAEHSPKQIQEWGLAPCVEDLVVRVSERAAVVCDFDVAENLPELAAAVNLHVFRIVQECLNNVEKYAQATKVAVKLDYDESQERLTVTVSDNGVGFDQKASAKVTAAGGTGIGGMNDRAKLLHVFHPTRLTIDSALGRGTTVVLELSLGRS